MTASVGAVKMKEIDSIAKKQSGSERYMIMFETGWQKQGHTWHIVPRNYSSKVGLKDLMDEKNEVMRGEKGRKTKKRIFSFFLLFF